LKAVPPSPAATGTRLVLVLAGSAFLLALAVRLPGLGGRSLGSEEQAVLAASRGLDPRFTLARGQPATAGQMRRSSGGADSRDRVPLYPPALRLWARAAGSSEAASRLPSALAGAATAGLVALAGGLIAGPGPAALAGLLVALSPIHVAASREASPTALLVLLLSFSLVLALRLEARRRPGEAVPLGLALGLVAASGVPAASGIALLVLAWLAVAGRDRRAFVLAVLAAAGVVAFSAGEGLLCSPVAPLDVPGWVPRTSAAGLLRCSGASFTRVAGFEYHLLVPHARYVLPLTLVAVFLLVRGATRLPRSRRVLLLSAAFLPFVLGATLSLSSGHVTPLQASRLVPALPFLAVLVAAGTASLPGRRGVLVALGYAVALALFLALSLTAPPAEHSPTRATAAAVARCLSAGTTVTVRRSLDALSLAAWDVRGPFVLRAPDDPTRPGPTVVVGPAAACTSGAFPGCPLAACPGS
jgi:mannosyltransferase